MLFLLWLLFISFGVPLFIISCSVTPGCERTPGGDVSLVLSPGVSTPVGGRTPRGGGRSYPGVSTPVGGRTPRGEGGPIQESEPPWAGGHHGGYLAEPRGRSQRCSSFPSDVYHHVASTSRRPLAASDEFACLVLRTNWYFYFPAQSGHGGLRSCHVRGSAPRKGKTS